MKELTFPESNNDYAVGIYPNKKMFEVRNENNGSFLFDQEGNLLYESDKSISVVDNVVYEEESSVHHEDIETWISTGTVYDLKGQSIGRVENMVGVLFNDKYFTIGEEYYQLVNLDGDVLIDESKKITDTESINNRKSEGLTDKSNRTLIKIKIKYRENAQNVEPKEALLNLETLEIVDLQDVLNTAP